MADPKGIPAAVMMGNEDVRRFMGQSSMAPVRPPAPPSLGVRPPAPPVAAPPPPAPPVEQTPEASVDNIDEAKAAPPLDPNEAYLKNLERLNVSRLQAAEIVDSMLFKGFYEEEVPLTKKMKVTFRTRGQAAVDRVNQAIEKADPKYNGSVFGLIIDYNLAASVVKYGPYEFDPSTDEGVEKARAYLKTLPTPIYQLLATKLSKFDAKCDAVMTEGAVENFF